MRIIENFRLDMADDHNITFSESDVIVTLAIDLLKIKSKSTARQKLVNHFASIIRNDYSGAEKVFLNVLENKAEYLQIVRDEEAAKAHRSINRSFKQIEKFIAEFA